MWLIYKELQKIMEDEKHKKSDVDICGHKEAFNLP